MGFAIVMDHFFQVFAGNVELIGDIVIATGEDDFAGAVTSFFGADNEITVRAVEIENALILVDVELVVVGDAAIVFERFGAARLFIKRGHGNVADFEKLGRGEENQIDGVMVKRIDDAAFIKQHGFEAAPFEFDATGETGRASAARWRRRIVPFVPLQKSSHTLVDFGQSSRQRGGIFARALGHVGPAAAFAAGGLATSPTNLPACTLPVRSLVTVDTMAMLGPFTEASTITALSTCCATHPPCCAVVWNPDLRRVRPERWCR